MDTQVLRHSTSHILAQAVKEIFPDVLLGVGPATEEGFYYDFDIRTPFTPDDLRKIEDRMHEIIRRCIPIKREEISRSDALNLFEGRREKYKLDLLQDIKEDIVSIYKQGDFVDLCKGPHLSSTSDVKVFKLLSVAGAYWRGDEKNPMLQRIYGAAFLTQEQLDEYLFLIEEAKKRDHRRLGKALELFSVDESVGPGLILWHPKGAKIRYILENYWREEHIKNGYEIVYTPHIAKLSLWETSGHTGFFQSNMFNPVDVEGNLYQLKPMNCPFHLLIYKSRIRSYRELPIRWAELGTVYRYEESGVLHGLMRARGFTQDDAHIICTPKQLDEEVERVLIFCLKFLRTLGFNKYDIYLSTRPEKFVGTLEGWEKATDALKKALENKNVLFKIDEGGGAFYGPKIDIKIKDSLNRPWQCSTIQVDFAEPERFDINYVADDGRPQRPIMIHRALLGSLERFFGVLIEHYAGRFPLWLAPVQVILLPITFAQTQYAKDIREKMLTHGFRVEIDDTNQPLAKRIRDAEMQKIPYIGIIGAKEVELNMIAVRMHNKMDKGNFTVIDFIDFLDKQILSKG
jgi:threonyl-tRNA synthetase